MSASLSPIVRDAGFPQRRELLKCTAAVAGSSGVAVASAADQRTGGRTSPVSGTEQPIGDLRRGMVGYMLAHEEFPVPELVQIGSLASQAGFHLLATSDHLQPWQANERHSGEAWVTLGALGAKARRSWR